MNIHRQGDVLLKPIAVLPKNLKSVTDKTLAYGEHTGHSHRFADPSLVGLYAAADGMRYLEVFQNADFVHEEHGPHIIEKGFYKQIQEREYDYFEEDMRAVVD